MASSRVTWLDKGQDPDYALLARYGIDGVYFDPRDPRVTASYLSAVRGHAGINEVGLYFVVNWWPGLTGGQFAEKVDAELKRIAWGGNAPVHLDIEHAFLGNDFIPFLVDAVTRWRQLRPTRQTLVTIDGGQGGQFGADAVQALVDANVRVGIQLYNGDMSLRYPDDIMDFLMTGFPADLIDGFYDAAHLPWRWRGCAYTMGRLPR